MAVLALTGGITLLTSLQGEQQRPGQQLTGILTKHGSGCMPPPELAKVIPIRSRQSEDTSDLVIEWVIAPFATGTRDNRDQLREGIEAAHAVAHAATVCADACLAQEMLGQLTGCEQTLLTTADICEATARVLSRRCGPDPAVVRALLTACWTACRAGREVCDAVQPIHHQSRACATACRSAERACLALLASSR